MIGVLAKIYLGNVRMNSKQLWHFCSTVLESYSALETKDRAYRVWGLRGLGIKGYTARVSEPRVSVGNDCKANLPVIEGSDSRRLQRRFASLTHPSRGGFRLTT